MSNVTSTASVREDDKVQLRSGGPIMTVEAVMAEEKQPGIWFAACVWTYDDIVFHRGAFPCHVLEKVTT